MQEMTDRARFEQAAPASTMWRVTAMAWDGFYGTTIHVSAPDQEAAARLATLEAVRFCRDHLRRNDFAYGMSIRDRDLEEKIARRAEAFHAEARAKIEPVPTGAVVLRAPGYSV